MAYRLLGLGILLTAGLTGCQSYDHYDRAVYPQSFNEAQFQRMQRNAIRDAQRAKAEVKANAQLNPQSPQPDFSDHGGNLN